MSKAQVEAAKSLAKHFTVRRFPSCDQCGDRKDDRVTFTDESNKDMDNPEHRALSDLIYGMDIDTDHAYLFVSQALDAIAELDDDEDIDDAVMPEQCYTYPLNKFVAENPAYFDEAKDTFGEPENYTLGVANAYALAQREVLNEVVSLVNEFSEDGEDECADCARSYGPGAECKCDKE